MSTDRSKRPISQLVLLVLAVEKFVQHMVVTYAFGVDLGDIRSTVVIDHVPLMVSGFIVGLLFAVSAYWLYQGRRAGYRLIFFLALFDFVGEFVAQGTMGIVITFSIVVATIILFILAATRKSWPAEPRSTAPGGYVST